MEMYYLCIDFVFQFIVEKYRNKLNQIKSNQVSSFLIGITRHKKGYISVTNTRTVVSTNM